MERGPLARTILETPLLIFRSDEGLAVLLDRCPHRFAPLSAGKVEGGRVECGYHGLVFDGTGRCVHNPHGPVTSAMRTPSFPAVEKHTAVWIWLGDSEAADPALVPDLSFIDETPSSARVPIYMPMLANYQLATDNIMDLTHSDWLHPTSLGGMMTQTRLRTFKRGSGIVGEWSNPAVLAPPLHQRKVPPPGLANYCIEVEWHAPAVMKLGIAVVPAEQERTEADMAYALHNMTPETASTTHYFACGTRKDRIDDPDLTRHVEKMLRHAFEHEDKPMLEGQQARIGDVDFWSLKPVILGIDAAAVQVRRKLDELIAKETSSQNTPGHADQSSPSRLGTSR